MDRPWTVKGSDEGDRKGMGSGFEPEETLRSIGGGERGTVPPPRGEGTGWPRGEETPEGGGVAGAIIHSLWQMGWDPKNLWMMDKMAKEESLQDQQDLPLGLGITTLDPDGQMGRGPSEKHGRGVPSRNRVSPSM